MNLRPPRSTCTDTTFPYTTLLRSRTAGGTIRLRLSIGGERSRFRGTPGAVVPPNGEDAMPTVSMTVNGKAVSGEVEARTLLVHFLREKLGLTGTHVGCDTSQCGACTIPVDGKSVKS